MKAIVWTKYGSPDGLQLREVATPSPKDNEVLIKIQAATASQADTEIRSLKLPLLFAIPLRLYLGCESFRAAAETEHFSSAMLGFLSKIAT